MELEGTAVLDPDLQGYLGLGVILGTGLAMGGFAVYHALTAEIEPASALYVLTPICFNVGLVAAGYQLWRTQFDGADLLRIAGWVFVGIVVFGLLVTWTVTHQYFRGGSFAHPGFVTVNNMNFGGLMGVIIGWLDASNRQNDRLEEFASIVSHDLRNPQNVAMLHLGTAREQADHDSLSTVVSSLDRMEEIVDDVLTMARQGEVDETWESVTRDR